jgi:phytoene synthase
LEALARYSIPDRYFFDMIAGVNSDLEPRQLCTFDELYQYCYQVAGTVGLTIMHIYGFKKSEATKVRRLAEKCGVAFQLTNILRDIREDAARGRVYLPNDDLKRFHVEKFSYDERFRALMEFEVTRARNYYDEALPLLELVSDEGRPSLKALIRSYSRLLDRIVEADYNVLTRRISVSKVELLRIAARAQAEHLRSKIKRPTNSDRG